MFCSSVCKNDGAIFLRRLVSALLTLLIREYGSHFSQCGVSLKRLALAFLSRFIRVAFSKAACFGLARSLNKGVPCASPGGVEPLPRGQVHAMQSE